MKMTEIPYTSLRSEINQIVTSANVAIDHVLKYAENSSKIIILGDKKKCYVAEDYKQFIKNCVKPISEGDICWHPLYGYILILEKHYKKDANLVTATLVTRISLEDRFSLRTINVPEEVATLIVDPIDAVYVRPGKFDIFKVKEKLDVFYLAKKAFTAASKDLCQTVEL